MNPDGELEMPAEAPYAGRKEFKRGLQAQFTIKGCRGWRGEVQGPGSNDVKERAKGKKKK